MVTMIVLISVSGAVSMRMTSNLPSSILMLYKIDSESMVTRTSIRRSSGMCRLVLENGSPALGDVRSYSPLAASTLDDDLPSTLLSMPS